MGKEHDKLTKDQKAVFASGMQRLGLKPTDLIHDDTLDTGATPGPTILSADPSESHIPPIMVPVKDIAEFKKMKGIPDEHYKQKQYSDRTIDYPPELPPQRAAMASKAADGCDLEYQLEPEEHENIKKAAQAYVLGNSEKIKHYEPAINKLMFPAQIAAFTGDAIVVRKGKPLIIKPGKNPNNTVALNYAKITVEKGGQIIVEANADITTQVFICED